MPVIGRYFVTIWGGLTDERMAIGIFAILERVNYQSGLCTNPNAALSIVDDQLFTRRRGNCHNTHVGRGYSCVTRYQNRHGTRDYSKGRKNGAT